MRWKSLSVQWTQVKIVFLRIMSSIISTIHKYDFWMLLHATSHYILAKANFKNNSYSSAKLTRPRICSKTHPSLAAISHVLSVDVSAVSCSFASRSVITSCRRTQLDRRPLSIGLSRSDVGTIYHCTYTTSSHSVNSPLSQSITPSLFRSRLKTYLFHKSFPP